MYSQENKSNENKSRAIANSVAQKKSNGRQGFGFVDNRPEAIAQRKLQEMANNSPRISQLKTYQQMAIDSPQTKQTGNLQAISDKSTIQAKFGGKFYNYYIMGLPSDFSVKGAVNERPTYYTPYSYDVHFTYNDCIATVNLRTITGSDVSKEDWDAYKREVEAKVSEVFDDKISIAFSGEEYPLKVKVNLHRSSGEEDQEAADYPSVNFNTVNIHAGQGRADAGNFRIGGDGVAGARGYIAAHEIGHHMGLYDEYADATVPGRAVHNDGSIMTETWPRPRDNFRPAIRQRHIDLIKDEIENTLNAKLQEERRVKEQEAKQKKSGALLPI